MEEARAVRGPVAHPMWRATSSQYTFGGHLCYRNPAMVFHRPGPTPPLAVLALGGNALISPDDVGTQRDQARAALRMAKAVVAVMREGYRVLLVHGNGPQVGRELLRSEEASTKLPPRPLDVCVAATQGSMGSRLSLALRQAMKAAGIQAPVATVCTHALVDPNDPGFGRPTKPIGPFYTPWRARELTRGKGWHMVEDAGRGWRQVVASPQPLDVLELEAIEALLGTGHVVIAGGGGGVPLAVDARGHLVGVEAVIDKDHTAALLADHLGAHILIFLTGVEHVFTDFTRPEQRAIGRIAAEELRSIERAGEFAEGSIGPKVRAVLDFVEDGGEVGIITTSDKLVAALSDRAGTRVTRDGGDPTRRLQLDLFSADEAAARAARQACDAALEDAEQLGGVGAAPEMDEVDEMDEVGEVGEPDGDREDDRPPGAHALDRDDPDFDDGPVTLH